jgi:hypothetical protein
MVMTFTANLEGVGTSKAAPDFKIPGDDLHDFLIGRVEGVLVRQDDAEGLREAIGKTTVRLVTLPST